MKRFSMLAVLLGVSLGIAGSANADDTHKTTHKTTTHKTTTTQNATSDDDDHDTDVAGQPGGAVGEANRAADDAADAANSAIVGRDQERQNQGQAQSAAVRERERQDMRRDAAEKSGPKTSQTTTTAADVVADTTRATDRPGRYRPFALEVNPLGMFVGGRFSAQAEWAPAVHHAIVLSPHFVHTTSNVDVSPNTTVDQSFTGFGGEIGYRYYTGHRGMNGVFVGPSAIAGTYNAGLPNGDQPFTNIGVAVDAGVKQIFFDHLALGAGVGVEYLKVSHDFGDLPVGPSAIAETGFKPRLLGEVGYAF